MRVFVCVCVCAAGCNSAQHVLLETIVESEDANVWAVLMPAVYQLVPGSMIAKLCAPKS